MAKKPPSKLILPLFIGLLCLMLIIFLGKYTVRSVISTSSQTKIAPFYMPPDLLPPGKPGTLLKKEVMNLKVKNLKKAYRIMYLTELPNGKPAVSSGMIFIPDRIATEGGRPVLAWAHGTSGMGPNCAPSRAKNPLSDMDWLPDALNNNWVVVATDYQGLGTPGTQLYLIGQSEANDVLNSVRATHNIPDAKTNNTFILWGHSQGGHSVFFANQIAQKYSP